MRPPFNTEDTIPIQAIRRAGAGWAALAIAGFLLIIVAGAAVLGYRAGLAKHADLSATQTAADIAQQYALGLEDLAAGHLVTAGERFRYVLSLDPGHAGAAEKLAEINDLLQQTAAAPGPAPAPAATIAPTVDAEAAPEDLLAQAAAALEAGDWDRALALLGQLQQTDPGFEAGRVQEALHRAYLERGLQRIADYRLQEGILDLDQAELYGELDEDAQARRVWATLYVRGNALWGADWPASIAIFEDLYRAAPYFYDTIDKLHGAYVGYGDQLWAAGDPCGAAAQYAKAGDVLEDAGVAGKRQAARKECETGTPTPTPGVPEAEPTETPTP